MEPVYRSCNPIIRLHLALYMCVPSLAWAFLCCCSWQRMRRHGNVIPPEFKSFAGWDHLLLTFALVSCRPDLAASGVQLSLLRTPPCRRCVGRPPAALPWEAK